MERQILDEQERKEKERDRAMVHNAVAREEALNKLESDEKEARRQEAKNLMSLYAQGKADKEAEEKILDKLTLEEEQKQWKMREAQWRKEEEAKVQLMREVYESRATNIEHLKRLNVEKKDSVKRDAVDVARQVEEQ